MSNGENPYRVPNEARKTKPFSDGIRPSGARLFATILVGTLIGGLVAKLGGYEFQRHVRVFHANSAIHCAISDIACVARPIAWFFPTLFGMYYCVRNRVHFNYILCFGILGGGFGWLSSGYVHANPGPNYSTAIYDVPIWCFVGTVLGSVVQTMHWPPTVA